MIRSLVLAALITTLCCPGSLLGQTVKTFSNNFDVYDEVIAFTGQWIESHPGVQADYDKLVEAAATEDGDRPPSPGTRIAIKWLVPQSTTKVDEDGGTKEEELVFLVKQALSNSFSGGFSVEDNIVARILVTTKETLVPDPKKEGEFITKKVEATFTWGGFVKVEITPLGAASAAQEKPMPPPAPAAETEAALRAYLPSPKNSYGWQPVKGGNLYDFFPDGRIAIQGPDGEATMWEGTWKLRNNQLTIVYEDNDGKTQKNTFTAQIYKGGLLLDATQYKRYP